MSDKHVWKGKFCANKGAEGETVKLLEGTNVYGIEKEIKRSNIQVDLFSPGDTVVVLSGPHDDRYIAQKVNGDDHNSGRIGFVYLTLGELGHRTFRDYEFGVGKRIAKITSARPAYSSYAAGKKCGSFPDGSFLRVISGPHDSQSGMYYVYHKETNLLAFASIEDQELLETCHLNSGTEITVSVKYDQSKVFGSYESGSEIAVVRGPYVYASNYGPARNTYLARYFVRVLSDGIEGYMSLSTQELDREHCEFLPYPEDPAIVEPNTKEEMQAVVTEMVVPEADVPSNLKIAISNANPSISWESATSATSEDANKETISFLTKECDSLKSQIKIMRENQAELQEAFSRQATNAIHTPPATNVAINEAVDVAYRTAASQLVKLARSPLAGGHSHMHEILKTDLGGAMISAFLSIGMMAMPENEHIKRLCKELRIKAAVDASDAVVDLISEPIRKIISDFGHKQMVDSSFLLTEPNKLSTDNYYVDNHELSGNNKNK